MKLRNKKTGDIVEVLTDSIAVDVLKDREDITGYYTSLAELNAEWEDYEEPKEHWHIGCEGDVFIDNTERYLKSYSLIGNDFETKEEAEQAVEKLKAWKRLKDKNFRFLRYSALGFGEIDFSLDFEDIDDEGEIGELRHDLDLLFGGEE